MQFGFTLKPENSIERTLALTRQAEAAGFDYGWLFDSHVLWRDPYPLLTLMAGATTRLRLGTCVTNPATREPSVTASTLALLDEISGRPDGPRHRARRLRAPRPGQAADDDGHARGGDPGHPGARRGRDDRVRGHGPPLHLDAGLDAPGLGRRLRADGPGDDRAGRRRRDPPARRPGPDRLVRRAAARRRGRRGPAAGIRAGPGRGPGPRRRPGRLPRADALVPGARQQPRRRPREQVPARPAARVPDRLHPGPRGLRLPPPRRGRLVERRVRRTTR